MTAEALIARIKARGGRVHCMRSRMVFCLTDDEVLRDGLVELGGRYHVAPGGGSTAGGYKRARDSTKLEWDIWIHMIPVEGPTTIYEAAGGKLPPDELAARRKPENDDDDPLEDDDELRLR